MSHNTMKTNSKQTILDLTTSPGSSTLVQQYTSGKRYSKKHNASWTGKSLRTQSTNTLIIAPNQQNTGLSTDLFTNLNGNTLPVKDAYNNQWSYSGSLVYTTSQNKGGNALYSSSTGQLISPYVQLCDTDFTIDWWQYFGTYQSATGLCAYDPSTNAMDAHWFMFQHETNGNFTVYGGNSYTVLESTTTARNNWLGKWCYMTITYQKSTNKLRFFTNGTLRNTRTTQAFNGEPHVLKFNVGTGSYIDNVHIRKGICKWQNAFTMPVAEWRFANGLTDIISGLTMTGTPNSYSTATHPAISNISVTQTTSSHYLEASLSGLGIGETWTLDLWHLTQYASYATFYWSIGNKTNNQYVTAWRSQNGATAGGAVCNSYTGLPSMNIAVSSFPTNTWRRDTVTCDGSKISYYKDTALVGSSSGSISTLKNWSAPYIMLGRCPNYSSGGWTNFFSNVTIYNVACTPWSWE